MSEHSAENDVPVCPECRQPVTAHRARCRQPRTKDELLRALGGDMGAMQDPQVKRLLAALPERVIPPGSPDTAGEVTP